MWKKTNRENVIDALDGKCPERIPFTIYGSMAGDGPEWQELFEKGLCYMPRVTLIKETMNNVEVIVQEETAEGKKAVRHIIKTPVGEISQYSVDYWPQEHYLKTPEDYKVMSYIVKNTTLELKDRLFTDMETEAGDRGITLVRATRTPYQKILVDYAGLENFSYHLADGFDEMEELMESVEEKYMLYFKLIAQSSAKYIQMPENLTSEQSGPERFKKYHMPAYKKMIPILHNAGKKVFAHCDGKLSCLAPLIAQTELDGIESFTLPPEGDMGYEQARAVFFDKIIWNNINLSTYKLPYKEIKNRILSYIPKASAGGSRLLFGVSEDRPENWHEPFLAVIEAINEYAGMKSFQTKKTPLQN